MTEHEELVELRRIGDHMQSSLSRVLEGVRETGVNSDFTYEQGIAMLESDSAIQEWTNVRRKSMRLFARQEVR